MRPDARNDLLNEILVAFGGSEIDGTRNEILKAIVEAASATAGKSIRNDLLKKYLLAIGGTASQPETRNSLLIDIVEQRGGTPSYPIVRNNLLQDWLHTILAWFPLMDALGNILYDTSGNELGYYAEPITAGTFPMTLPFILG